MSYMLCAVIYAAMLWSRSSERAKSLVEIWRMRRSEPDIKPPRRAFFNIGLLQVVQLANGMLVGLLIIAFSPHDIDAVLVMLAVGGMYVVQALVLLAFNLLDWDKRVRRHAAFRKLVPHDARNASSGAGI
jgi:hypothetical protein